MEESQIQEQKNPVAGPGEILRETRQKLGLEPDNVAQILHLSRQQIQALDANDFENLPEPTYVRGYLRSYCQLLNIDPTPLIEKYNEAIGDWKSTTYSDLAVEKQISSNDNVIRFSTLGVIGVVFGLAIVWWLGEEEVPVTLSAPTEVAAVPAGAPETPLVDDAVIDKITEVISTTKPIPESAPEPTTPTQPVVVPKAVEKSSEQQSKANQISSPITTAETAVEATTVAITNPTVASGAQAKLVLRTSGPSWADVRDANDTKLLYETIAAGRVITVEGETPLQVFLGNANVVTLELNGAEYDFSRFRRGLTARFSIGNPDGSSE